MAPLRTSCVLLLTRWASKAVRRLWAAVASSQRTTSALLVPCGSRSACEQAWHASAAPYQRGGQGGRPELVGHCSLQHPACAFSWSPLTIGPPAGHAFIFTLAFRRQFLGADKSGQAPQPRHQACLAIPLLLHIRLRAGAPGLAE